MQSYECRDCKYVKWMVGIGLGVRCGHPKREPEEGIAPVISQIKDCQLKETITKDKSTDNR